MLTLVQVWLLEVVAAAGIEGRHSQGSKPRAGLGLHGRGSQKAGYARGLLPANTLQAVAPAQPPLPLQCHSGRVERAAWCSMRCRSDFGCFSALRLLLGTYLMVACICEGHALLPVLVLLLLQASVVPASTKALEHAEQECGPVILCSSSIPRKVHINVCICACHALLPVLVLLLPQASPVPASTKAQEHAERGCGPYTLCSSTTLQSCACGIDLPWRACFCGWSEILPVYRQCLSSKQQMDQSSGEHQTFPDTICVPFQ